jgi:hypothetical protein
LVDAESGNPGQRADRPGDLGAFQAARHAVGSLGLPPCGELTVLYQEIPGRRDKIFADSTDCL